ncbi:hypothetical protein SteCoe_32999 [Stentor coeruleus]|uniref:Uncharacterized protein n=1 Tax=Stentor coeruleus TaxID=5963 RepID=A0A1R2AXU1_9CILI|nr:hypothetical protein SteCoe_32999 [Stentor coeruleus]
MRHEKPKQKRLIWRATQKELRQWDEDLGRINKEEASLKKTLKNLNMKYQKIIATRYEKANTVSYEEDRKQKELERSLAYIDNLLKGLKKKNKNKIS